MSSSSCSPYNARIAVVVSGWPRLSETFALNELLALRRNGMLAAIFATKADGSSQPDHDQLCDLVVVLPDGTEQQQADCLSAHARTLSISGVHAYFAHRPAAVAMRAAANLGVPFGFSTHAVDARKVTAETLGAQSAAAAVVIACNPDIAGLLVESGIRPLLIPHGVDVKRFQPEAANSHQLSAGEPLSILAVGRFVEKKGFPVLLSALARTEMPHTLTLVGSGNLGLGELVGSLGLTDRVQLVGSLNHDQLPDLYRRADIVAVPSIVAANNDRDGLPNVVLEAMASGCCVVASRVAAIPSAIEHRLNGVLIEPGNADELARELDRLALDPNLRRQLGSAARTSVIDRFSLDRCARRMCDALEAAYGGKPLAQRAMSATNITASPYVGAR